jgi:hypothetical protein
VSGLVSRSDDLGDVCDAHRGDAVAREPTRRGQQSNQRRRAEENELENGNRIPPTGLGNGPSPAVADDVLCETASALERRETRRQLQRGNAQVLRKAISELLRSFFTNKVPGEAGTMSESQVRRREGFTSRSRSSYSMSNSAIATQPRPLPRYTRLEESPALRN